MKRFKNKNIGAKVIVDSVLIDINPIDKWKSLKKVSGTIVERGEHEQYYHTCSGAQTYIRKHLIYMDSFESFAIKLDNDVKDIEGNNIIVVRDFDLKFVEYLPKSVKIISKIEYNKAKKLIEKYEYQQTLL